MNFPFLTLIAVKSIEGKLIREGTVLGWGATTSKGILGTHLLADVNDDGWD
jgi:hypothetical protein